MAESSLYRQRLEVIAEKRRLQEEIRAARLELEEEKLRVERLKRKSLRERWLMDGAAEGTDWPKDSTSQDPQSPEGQAQARIRNLEDSLFTLQSQLQLLQSASTGAQHKPLGRPTWRKQGHRPLSLPIVEAGPAGGADLDKRASLPPGPAGMSPESLSEPREEAVGVLPASRQVPGMTAASSEANGPCPGLSPPPEQEPSKGVAAVERGVGEAKGGGVVKVVWEGLRATEDCAIGATGPELEAKVEEVVLEAIGDRQVAGSPELPSWVKEDRNVVEVVWEGVGGTEGSDSVDTGEGWRGREAAQPSSPRLPEQGVISREGEGSDEGSPEGNGRGGSGGEEGSFIWVERSVLSEEWEELLVEGLEGPGPVAREGGDEGLLGKEKRGGEETWEVERRQAEESLGVEKKGGEEKLGTEREEAKEPPGIEKKGDEEQLGAESRGVEESLKTEREGIEEPLGVERKEVEESLRAEKERGEEKLGAEKKEDEGPLREEKKGDEVQPGAEKRAVEEPLVAERKGGEEKLEAEKKGGEELLETEKTQGIEQDPSPEEQRESGGGKEPQAEEVSEAGASLGTKEEPRPEEGGLQPQEKQEGPLEEEAEKPQTPAEGQGPSGDATPLLAETSALEQPTECQPLLPVEGPSAHPVPTYAPARQPEPPAPHEGEEARAPKQKTCQCCAVM
ncbi:paralemmin-3 [Trichechus manatus latirostris]|uniref:Paralemmin-3 n=1 Tax=Trichechus manatus latirostris TaxID=127582 RepID=A0A2Y9G1H7_TRIMA|nr:paralemmin-3 [Trichechus manatus latirostris]